MAFFTKTLDLVLAVDEHGDTALLSAERDAERMYRTQAPKITNLVKIHSVRLDSVQETAYPVRNTQELSYVIRYVLSVEAPTTDIANKAIEAVFQPQIKRGLVGGRDNTVLVARTVT